MTLFIDLRAIPSGGGVADEAKVWQGSDATQPVNANAFADVVGGRDLLLVMHGFNVGRASGVASLSTWIDNCDLPASYLPVAVLWPGDSAWLPVVDYVYEGVEAIASGKLLAGFLDRFAATASSVSLVSHSLGARVLLEAGRRMKTAPAKVFIMAGAIENNCLAREYADAARRVAGIYTLSSRRDWVLEYAFPPGNLVGEIVMHGHPYDRTALGRAGPDRPLPDGVRVTAWQIPDGWDYGHLDYLSKDPGPQVPPPVTQPAPDTNPPFPEDPQSAGWKSSWSAEAVAALVRS